MPFSALQSAPSVAPEGATRHHRPYRPRLDRQAPGAAVVLELVAQKNRRIVAFFVDIHGEGEDRRAHFYSFEDGVLYEWEAYRCHQRWCFGPEAQPISFVGPLDPDTVL